MRENELMRQKREQFHANVLSADSKEQFIKELRQRQREQLEYRGQELQSKIDTIQVHSLLFLVFSVAVASDNYMCLEKHCGMLCTRSLQSPSCFDSATHIL